MKGKVKKIAAVLAGMMTMLTAVSGYVPQTEVKTQAASNIIAFPGAAGGGKYATGGRGGEVYHVTNLNDSGAGSFRDAVSKSNRIVVFDVSGTIELTSNVVVQSNITIAGQTAPGGSGITLKNYKLGLGGTNCIVRYVSSRPGPYKATSSGNDALGGAGGSNSIIDHCSIGWASDEQWGLYSKNDNYTCQYTVIGPANSWGGHAKGVHGFGIMLGRSNVSYDHNLIIHNVSRNFRGKVPDQNSADFTNNIIYDWGYQTTYGTIGHINYVNNTLKAGNSTTSGYHYAQISDNENFKVYLSGNRILNKDNTVRNDVNSNWSAISYGGSKSEATARVDEHFPVTTNGEDVSTVLTAESAEASYNHVISFAGNGISPDQRTAIDRQCAEETLNGTGSCSGTAAYDSSVTDLDKYKIACGVTYEYPSAVMTKTITDADNDGMDDEWEMVRGLNPSDPTDTNGDYCGQGYTNIEYYINDLTVNSFPEGVITPSPETSSIVTTSAYETIEAENYSSESGTRTEDKTGGGQNVGYIENGDYLAYKYVDFGEDGALSFIPTLAGGAANIEIYLDSIDSAPFATCRFDGTGNWQTWKEASFNIPKITGTHTVYLKFTGGEGYLLNIDSFKFGKQAVALNGNLVKNLTVNDTAHISGWALDTDMAATDTIFGDRDFTYTNLPDTFIGAEQIKTACDSKAFTENAATFTAGEDITAYVALDNRVTTVPAWLSDWTVTDISLTSSNDVTFVVYKKDFSKDSNVTLGSNGQSAYCVNYSVFVTAKSTVTQPDPTDPTEPTTEPTEPEKVNGDVNYDKSVNSTDADFLKNFLIKKSTLADDLLYDVNSDRKINVFDWIYIKRNML